MNVNVMALAVLMAVGSTAVLAAPADKHPQTAAGQQKPPSKPNPAKQANADFQKAVALFNEGNIVASAPLFKKVQKVLPNRADVYYYLGLCETSTPNHGAAIVHFTKAISLRVDYVEAFFERGKSRAALQQYGEAIADYDKVVALQPAQLQAWYNRGQAAAAIKNDQEAVNSYAKVIELDPQNAYAHYYIGLSYYNLKQKDKAIKHFSTFVALAPDAPEAAAIKKLLQQLAGW